MRPEDHREWNPPCYFGLGYEKWEEQEERRRVELEAERWNKPPPMEVDEEGVTVKWEDQPHRIPSPEY